MTTLAEEPQLQELIQRACAGDERAQEAVLAQHLPLVRGLASRYSGRGEPFDDLVQVGSIGLVLALKRFDPERGVPFRSFAIPTIVGEIRRHFRDRAWALHVPRGPKELSLRLNRAVEQLTAELGRSPTVSELAQAVGAPEDEIVDALDIANAYSTRSLFEPQFEDGDESSAEVMFGGPDPGYAEVEESAVVEAGLAALDPRSRRIVELRFFDGWTQSEIAAEMGISQMHVSRLLRHSLEVMRGRLDDQGSDLL
jgi:RNA polymerase sigma-B factor